MAATATIMSPGDTLGGYRILEVIGIGGMAIVYRAEQMSLGREVALKVLAPEFSRDESFRERFRREGKNIAALDHTHIVTVHDSGEVDGRFYLAMRLVKGATLADRMQEGDLNALDVLKILIPIADALDTAHAIGLVHRDVKPQNILLSGRGEVYLADFGVAKGGQSAGLTQTGSFVGSFNYAAPEQALGQATSGATDVYALTAVLYQCFTGQVPYPRDTDASVLLAHISAPPPRVKGPHAEEFNAILARGLAKDPADRYSSGGELMVAVASVVEELSLTERLTSPALEALPFDGATTGPAASRPAAPVEATKPTAPVEVTKPVAPVEATKPAAPVGGTVLSVPVEATKPAAALEGTKPAAAVEGTVPAAVVEGTVPAAVVEGTVAAAVVEGTLLSAPADATKPAVEGTLLSAPADATKPAAPVEGTMLSAPAEATMPAASVEGTMLSAPAQDTKPAAPAPDTKPAAPAPDTTPAAPVDGTKLAEVDGTKVSEPAGATKPSELAAGTTISAGTGVETETDAGRKGPVGPASAPPDAARRRPPTAAIAAGIGLLVLVVVVIIIVASSGGSKTANASAPNTHSGSASARVASSGPLSVSYSSPWKPTTAAVTGSSALASAPVELTSGQVNLGAGLLKSSGPVPGDVPPQLVSSYGPPQSSTDATVARGSGRAYTWNKDGTQIVAYVLPGAAGDAALICSAVSGTPLSNCTTLASSATIGGSFEQLPAGPDTNFAGQLAAPLKPVASMRDGLHGLNQSSLTARAKPARQLADAEKKAASTIGSLTVPARYHAQVARLVTALKNESSAFSALAGAAQSNNSGAYGSLAGKASSASNSVSAAAAALAAARLGLPALRSLKLAGPPPPPSSSSGTSSTGSSGNTGSSGSSSSSAGSTGGSSSSSSPSSSSPSSSPPSSPPPSSPPPKSGGCTQNCVGGGA